MNSKNDFYRANAIRVLSRILDPSMASQLDRYLKTAVVDKSPFVASSALICGMQLMVNAPEVAKRWVNEVTESVSSKHNMVQFHALALLYELKRTDRLALHKVVMNLTKSFMKSTMAECLLIRISARVLKSERGEAVMEKRLMDYLDGCLRHKSEMVMFEAAKAMCELAAVDEAGSGGTTVFGYDMIPAITVHQIFLNSPTPVIRFASIRQLNKLAQQRAHLVARCNADMEPLLADQNRSIATLALTTLLKTGHESSVDRLVKQITSFMTEISDTFKIEVVRAVKQLALTYPNKHKVLMSFLSSNLREEGSAEFKQDIVEALILLVREIPQAKETGLLHLCEFIEDCEYPALCTMILSFLGEHAPATSSPAKFVRFIYNRLILENALVRAAGVDALAKIAFKCPALKRDILVLLESCTTDNDDEVRDRTNVYVEMLERSLEEEGAGAADQQDQLLAGSLDFSVDGLCEILQAHMKANKDAPFDPSVVPSEEAWEAQRLASVSAAAASTKEEGGAAKAAAGPASAGPAASRPSAAVEIVSKVEPLVAAAGISSLGALQHTSRPQQLTESEAEYTVQATKHMFESCIVVDFQITNTLNDQLLENVEVRLGSVDASTWEVVGCVPAESLPFDKPGSAYMLLKKLSDTSGVGAVQGTFSCSLAYTIKEAGDDLGYPDEYPVENLTLTTGDYVSARGLRPGDFKTQWDALGTQGVETAGNFSLSGMKTLEQAVKGLTTKLAMAPCEDSAKVEAGASRHTLLLSGTFAGGVQVLARCVVGMHPQHGCLLKLAVRSRNDQICAVIVGAVE